MSTSASLIPALGGAVFVLCLLLLASKRRADRLRDELEDERARQRSLSTIYGRINEQWFPLMDSYPYDSQGFRFIGSPIDGIQFEDDRVIFCEFKTNQSQLSSIQRRIRQLVQDGEVYWQEFEFRSD